MRLYVSHHIRAHETTLARAAQSRLAIVFGDQLDLDAALLRTLRPDDTVLMFDEANIDGREKD